MSDMKSQIVASVVGAVTGVVATALIGFLQVVIPIKGELDLAKKELVGLEQRYLYGQVNRESKQNGFGLEVFNVERLPSGEVRVKLLLNNLVGEERKDFKIYRTKSAVQTETLDVVTVSRVKLYNLDESNSTSVRANIPPAAKHIPIELELDGVDEGAKYLSSLNLVLGLGWSGSNNHTVVFNDLEIL